MASRNFNLNPFRMKQLLMQGTLHTQQTNLWFVSLLTGYLILRQGDWRYSSERSRCGTN